MCVVVLPKSVAAYHQAATRCHLQLVRTVGSTSGVGWINASLFAYQLKLMEGLMAVVEMLLAFASPWRRNRGI